MKALYGFMAVTTLGLIFLVACSSAPLNNVMAGDSASAVERTKNDIVGTWENSEIPGNYFIYYKDGTGIVKYKSGQKYEMKWSITSKYDRPFMEVTDSEGGQKDGMFVVVDGDVTKYWDPKTDFLANPNAKPIGVYRRVK